MTSQDKSRRQIAAAPSLSARTSPAHADSSRQRRRRPASVLVGVSRERDPQHTRERSAADTSQQAIPRADRGRFAVPDGPREPRTACARVGEGALTRRTTPPRHSRARATQRAARYTPHRIDRASGSDGVLDRGPANVGNTTVASIVWRVETLREESVVTLCATVDAAGSLDALLLRFGGRRWLAGRFAAALEQLHRSSAHPGGDTQLPADVTARPTTRFSWRGLRGA